MVERERKEEDLSDKGSVGTACKLSPISRQSPVSPRELASQMWQNAMNLENTVLL